jgi:hypothetical protein
MKHYSLLSVRFTLIVLMAIVLIGGMGSQVLGQSEPEATLLATTFTYQGYLEQNAVPYTGVCDLQVSLFDAASAGTQIGSTLTRTNVAVNGGIFNVQLDFGATAFDGQDRYLGINVRCPAGSGAYTPLTPRQPITPVPYAIYAGRAAWSGLQGVPAGFADSTDNDVVGGLTCASGQVAQFNGTTWICATISGGSGGGDGWALTGNLGTNPATNFLGTTDNQPFEIRVNNARAFRFEPNATSPNLIGGYSGNTVTPGVYGAVIGGGGDLGFTNRVTDNGSVVVGGHDNQAGDNAGTTSDRFGAVVVGGSTNSAQGFQAFIGGGQGNIVTGIRGVVVGGGFNSVPGLASVVGGGSGNSSNGEYATIPGGRNNQTGANYAFAAGRRAIANFEGAFVWGDSTDANVAATGVNTFTVRASGGTTFYADANLTTGVNLPAGGGAWAAVSDRNVKENLETVDPSAVLDALIAMPVSTWNYITQEEAIRHIGVMAQDFYAAFGVGEDDRHISTIDADGVAFAAIQGLNAKLEDENAALRAENTSQQAAIDELQARVEQLEALASGGQSASLLPFALLGGAGLLALVLRRR